MKALNLFLVWALAAWTAGAAVSVTPVGTGTGLDTNNPVAFGTNVGVAGSLSVVGALNAGEVAGAGALLVSNLTASRVLGTDADGYVTNLPAGTSGQVLKSTGSGYTWGSGGSSNLSDSAFTVVLNGDLQGSNSISASNLYGGTVNIGGTNATTLMAAYAATAPVSNFTAEAIFHVRADGATGDGSTDDTLAISNTLYKAAGGDHTNYPFSSTVWLSAGTYVLGQAPPFPSGDNAVLPIPHRAQSSAGYGYMYSTLRICGPPPGPSFDIGSNSSSTRSTNGAILYMTQTNGHVIRSGGTTGVYNMVHLVLENISIHVPDANYNDIALHLEDFANVTLKNVTVSTRTKHGGLTQDPLTTSIGIFKPRVALGDQMRMDGIDVSGFGTGIVLGEHTTADFITVNGCWRGITLAGGGTHANSIQHYVSSACQYPIYGPGSAAYLNISAWDNERISANGESFRSNKLDVASPANLIGGVDHYRVLDSRSGTYTDRPMIGGYAEQFKVSLASQPYRHIVQSNSSSSVYLRGDYWTKYSPDTVGPWLCMFKGRGSDYLPAVPSSGDGLGYLAFGGYDGSDFTVGSFFKASSVGTTSSGTVPSMMELKVGSSASALTVMNWWSNAISSTVSFTNVGPVYVRAGTTQVISATTNGLVSIGNVGTNQAGLTFPTNGIVEAPALALGEFRIWNSNGLALFISWNTNGTTASKALAP